MDIYPIRNVCEDVVILIFICGALLYLVGFACFAEVAATTTVLFVASVLLLVNFNLIAIAWPKNLLAYFIL